MDGSLASKCQAAVSFHQGSGPQVQFQTQPNSNRYILSMSLAGKVAVITGGGGGFGREFARALSELGAHIVVFDLDNSLATQTADLVNESRTRSNYGSKVAVAHRGDVRRPEDIEGAIKLAKSEFGGFDIMINNAGVMESLGYPFKMKRESIQRILDVNLTSVILGTQIACKHFRLDDKPGVVINVASAAGTFPVPMSPVYAAAKAGVVHFTRSMTALHQKDRIRVCALAPTYAKTPMVAAMGAELMRQGAIKASSPEDAAEQVAQSVGGWVEVSAVVKALLSLVLDDTKNGTVIKLTPAGAAEWPRRSSSTTAKL